MNNLKISIIKGSAIDRIRTSGIYISKDQFDYIRKQLPEIDSIKNDFALKGKVNRHIHRNKQGHCTYALQYRTLDSHQSIARFEISSYIEQGKGEKFKKENLKYYLSWTLWPHRLRQKELLPFHAALDVLLKELDIHDHPPIYSYAHTYRFASVKRLEIAADFPFLEPNTFIPWKPRGFVSWIHTDPVTGAKGATYLGLKGEAKDGFACYGKTQQLKETGQPPSIFSGHPRTRIESRRYKAGKIKELHKLKNFFLGLEIADLAIARALSDGAQWQQFLDLAMTYGSARAIAKTPIGKQRDKIIKMLRQAAHTAGWTPGKKKQIWDSYLRSVERLAPEAMGLTVKGKSKVQ